MYTRVSHWPTSPRQTGCHDGLCHCPPQRREKFIFEGLWQLFDVFLLLCLYDYMMHDFYDNRRQIGERIKWNKQTSTCFSNKEIRRYQRRFDPSLLKELNVKNKLAKRRLFRRAKDAKQRHFDDKIYAKNSKGTNIKFVLNFVNAKAEKVGNVLVLREGSKVVVASGSGDQEAFPFPTLDQNVVRFVYFVRGLNACWRSTWRRRPGFAEGTCCCLNTTDFDFSDTH